MKRSFIHNQGTAEEPEDGIINTFPVVGVLDGVSKPHGADQPPLILDSMSSGAWVARMVEKQIAVMALNGECCEILDIVSRVNQSFGNSLVARCGNLQSGLRPGVTFGLAKIDEFFVQVAQVGDSFVFVRKKDGELVFSPYSMRAFEEKDRELYSSAMSAANVKLFGSNPVSLNEKMRAEIRKEFWKLYLAPWIELRKGAINKPESPIGYGLLNGETEMLSFVWTRVFNQREVELVLLLTDGMIPKSILKKKKDEEIAKGIMSAYDRGGLEEILNQVRREERKVVSTNYIDQGEATGYALQF